LHVGNDLGSGDTPMTQARAERLAQRSGVHWATIYRYRAQLVEIDVATAIAGRTRGWKPLASRLSSQQEQGIEEAINALRKRPRVSARRRPGSRRFAARCRLLRVPLPFSPSIDA
jgi:putative transposase